MLITLQPISVSGVLLHPMNTLFFPFRRKIQGIQHYMMLASHVSLNRTSFLAKMLPVRLFHSVLLRKTVFSISYELEEFTVTKLLPVY